MGWGAETKDEKHPGSFFGAEAAIRKERRLTGRHVGDSKRELAESLPLPGASACARGISDMPATSGPVSNRLGPSRPPHPASSASHLSGMLNSIDQC